MAVLTPDTLHLHPRSELGRRRWELGGDDDADPLDGRNLWLPLAARPDVHESFASLRSILDQLRPLADPERYRDIEHLEDYLREACPAESDAGPSHGRLYSDSVTLTVMRRISRESVYTARVIDLAARTINEVISRAGCATAYVHGIERLDRPSIKVLARAMLLLEDRHGFSWVWRSGVDPVEPASADDPYVASRSTLLRQLVGIVQPTLVRVGAVLPLRRPLFTSRSSLYDVSAALVVQNYDACILACDQLLAGDDACSSEVMRLLALASINLGMAPRALNLLQQAEAIAPRPGRAAHLCYLQGLIEAKRSYSLQRSEDHYQRGLAVLDGCEASDDDLALERAWLYNGLALNQAILWRTEPSRTRITDAFRLTQEAFALVRDGDDPARSYLRFNLLANSAFLLEIVGDLEAAARVLGRMFNLDPKETSTTSTRDVQAVLAYRLGVLHYKAGHLDEAESLLADALAGTEAVERWAARDHVLRALGALLLNRGRYGESAAAFAEGLTVCRNARSASGTREHGRGLMSALLLTGDERQACELHEWLATEEEIVLDNEADRSTGWVLPRPPAPKLPPYVPEVDLEEIPTIDINRFLARALLSGAGMPPWSQP